MAGSMCLSFLHSHNNSKKKNYAGGGNHSPHQVRKRSYFGTGYSKTAEFGVKHMNSSSCSAAKVICI
jgi:hypothetical protein